MAIRFSCCDSQPTMFMNRSRLPWMPSTPLVAKSESPTTDHPRFRLRRVRVVGLRRLGRRRACRRRHGGGRSTIGPFLSPFASSSATWPVASSALMSASAQLCGLDLDERLRRVAVDAAGHRRHRARQRKRGHDAEALGDRVRRVARGDGHRRVGADQAAHAAGVDDDVVADVDAPFVRERDQVGERRRRPPCPADRSSAAACRALSRYVFSASTSGGKKSVCGPATTTTDASSGHRSRSARARASRPCSSRAERLADGAVAVALGGGGVLLAVALREVDLPLLAADRP